MSAALVIHDELSGFYPGNQGSAVVLYESSDVTVTISTKYAVDFEDTSVTEDRDGWEWGLGGTRLNVLDITNLRDYLNGVLAKIGAVPDEVLTAHGLLTDAEILEKNPGLDPRVLALDPAIGISDDTLVHPKFLFQMGWTQQMIANEYSQYARFAHRLSQIGA